MAVEQEKVKLLLLSLNVNKSCGPDGIHPRMLIELADLISGPLTFIMRSTFREGCIPLDWKKANVSPTYHPHVYRLQDYGNNGQGSRATTRDI